MQVAEYNNSAPSGFAGNISSSTATWSYDDSTGLISQTGGLFQVRFNNAPTSTLWRTSITGLVIGNGGAASAATYVCTEGNFGGNVGASICGNYSFGANFANESTATWGPGTSTSRAIGGDDLASGTQESIAALNGMTTISWVGTALVLHNGTCTGACFTTPGGFNDGQKWTFNAGPQVPVPAAAGSSAPPSARWAGCGGDARPSFTAGRSDAPMKEPAARWNAVLLLASLVLGILVLEDAARDLGFPVVMLSEEFHTGRFTSRVTGH